MLASVNRPLLCELIGPAGAGKSTSCGYLRTIDSAVRVRGGISKRNSLFSLALHTTLLLPAALILLLQCRRSGIREIKQLARLRVMRQAFRGDRNRGYGRALIVDEGPVFTLAWIEALGDPSVIRSPWFSSQIKRESRRWAHQLDLLIWLDANDELLTRRIRERAQGHYTKHLPEAEVAAFLDRYRETYKCVIESLVNDRRPAIVEFDTSADSGRILAEKILTAVKAAEPKS